MESAARSLFRFWHRRRRSHTFHLRTHASDARGAATISPLRYESAYRRAVWPSIYAAGRILLALAAEERRSKRFARSPRQRRFTVLMIDMGQSASLMGADFVHAT